MFSPWQNSQKDSQKSLDFSKTVSIYLKCLNLSEMSNIHQKCLKSWELSKLLKVLVWERHCCVIGVEFVVLTVSSLMKISRFLLNCWIWWNLEIFTEFCWIWCCGVELVYRCCNQCLTRCCTQRLTRCCTQCLTRWCTQCQTRCCTRCDPVTD